MRRVLFHFSNSFDPEQKVGGAEIAALAIMKRLPKEGWQPYALMHAEGLLIPQLERHRIPWKIVPLTRHVTDFSRNRSPSARQAMGAAASIATLAWRVCRAIREWKIDLVHAHHMYGYLSCGIAARLCRVPCIWHLHESWEPGFVCGTLSRLGPFVADHVITIAEYETTTAAQLVARVGHTLVPNAFDFDELAAAQKRPSEDVRAEFGIRPDHILIGYVSQLAPYKGQRTFLQAFASLAQSDPRCRALVVGGPRKSYQWFRDALLQDARELGLGDRVVFTGVRLDVADIMNALDICVCVSENQEFNRVLVEAMYFAKPVLATDLRGGSIVVETGRTGILVPPCDAIAMTRALACLVADSELRKNIGSNAREYVLATFPDCKIVPKYAEVYSRLLHRNSSSEP